MKRLLPIGAIALAAALSAPGYAGASHAGAGGGPRDFAVGTGQNQIGHVSFAAHGGPSPFEPVTGHFTAKGALVQLGLAEAGAFHFEGPVTCLTVVGNRAGLFYPLKNAKPPTYEGQGIFIFLEDNGRSQGGTSPDRIGVVGPLPIPPEPLVCPPGPTPLEVMRGNLTVHDAP